MVGDAHGRGAVDPHHGAGVRNGSPFAIEVDAASRMEQDARAHGLTSTAAHLVAHIDGVAGDLERAHVHRPSR